MTLEKKYHMNISSLLGCIVCVCPVGCVWRDVSSQELVQKMHFLESW